MKSPDRQTTGLPVGRQNANVQRDVAFSRSDRSFSTVVAFDRVFQLRLLSPHSQVHGSYASVIITPRSKGNPYPAPVDGAGRHVLDLSESQVPETTTLLNPRSSHHHQTRILTTFQIYGSQRLTKADGLAFAAGLTCDVVLHQMQEHLNKAVRRTEPRGCTAGGWKYS